MGTEIERASKIETRHSYIDIIGAYERRMAKRDSAVYKDNPENRSWTSAREADK
jgi:hypothetical protein